MPHVHLLKAKGYELLKMRGKASAPELAQALNCSRKAAYMVLLRLCQSGHAVPAGERIINDRRTRVFRITSLSLPLTKRGHKGTHAFRTTHLSSIFK